MVRRALAGATEGTKGSPGQARDKRCAEAECLAPSGQRRAPAGRATAQGPSLGARTAAGTERPPSRRKSLSAPEADERDGPWRTSHPRAGAAGRRAGSRAGAVARTLAAGTACGLAPPGRVAAQHPAGTRPHPSAASHAAPRATPPDPTACAWARAQCPAAPMHVCLPVRATCRLPSACVPCATRDA